ncbi:SNF2 family N-terminal domain-containing protein [Geopyxis carbonaria]|nr:SNF2 family N-terminal domain-containing protein [Geopyxis carbonaria]
MSKSKGGILADDMGLGKTIQSIALILTRPHPAYPIAEGASLSPDSKKRARKEADGVARGTLVIAPLALIRQWEGELEARVEPTHKLRVLVHHGPKRTSDPRVLRRYDVVITTYDTIRTEHAKSSYTEGGDGHGEAFGVFGTKWWRIICDEAHTIKNRLAKQTKAAYALKSLHRWCLTGTPLQNNVEELQSLFKFLNCKPFDDLPTWKEKIALPMKNNKGGLAIQRLRAVLAAVMLRRTKDVLRKDAEKTGNTGGLELKQRDVQTVKAIFGEKEQQLYDNLEARTQERMDKMMAELGGKTGVSYTSALILLLRLRQACNHPHLIAGKIHKDKDSGLGLATPRKKRSAVPSQDDVQEEDDLADLMGGLSVDQQKCEVCLETLEPQDVKAGDIRCKNCNNDLKMMSQKDQKQKQKREKREKKERIQKPEKRRRPAVLDSDDEDDEGNGSQAEEGSNTEDEGDTSFASENDDGLIEPDVESEYESDFENESSTNLFPSTKIVKLLEILRKETREKNKTIVFSQFTSMLDLIEPFLNMEGITFTRYDGSMKNDDREASLRRLRGEGEFAPRKGREDKDWCGVLLCSLKCGALGLNLTAACRVVVLEPFWNPFVEEQAIDRVHRIGQKKDVVVYKLNIENSVEERIVLLQDEKRALAKAAFGDDGGKAKAAKLSLKDILNLFHRDDAKTDDVPALNTRTRLLVDVPSKMPDTPSRSPLPPASIRQDIAGGRYTSEEREIEREKRRAAERNNVFGRR